MASKCSALFSSFPVPFALALAISLNDFPNIDRLCRRARRLLLPLLQCPLLRYRAPTLPYIVVQDARPPTRLRNCRDKNISLAGTRRTQFFFGGVLQFSFQPRLHYKCIKSDPSQPTSPRHCDSRFSSHLSRPFYSCCSTLCIKIVPYSLNPIILLLFFFQHLVCFPQSLNQFYLVFVRLVPFTPLIITLAHVLSSCARYYSSLPTNDTLVSGNLARAANRCSSFCTLSLPPLSTRQFIAKLVVEHVDQLECTPASGNDPSPARQRRGA